jgi:hypothetical protein
MVVQVLAPTTTRSSNCHPGFVPGTSVCRQHIDTLVAELLIRSVPRRPVTHSVPSSRPSHGMERRPPHGKSRTTNAGRRLVRLAPVPNTELELSCEPA